MKKLINDPRRVVADSARGFGLAHSGLVRVNEDPLYIVRAAGVTPGKVGLLSGGGSGHEPLHAGFVGPGMLDAAVPGAMFSSPPPMPILEATRAVDGGAGVVHLIKNYTGDVLNFEAAAELAEAEGIDTRSVLIADDVALEHAAGMTGRRGVAGALLVEKIAGAAAEAGEGLDTVARIARYVAGQVRSMGVALRAPTVPHAGRPSFDLGEDEVEIGIGIHGEPGRERVRLGTAAEITQRLIVPVISDLNLRNGEEALLLVNGMGGTPLSELYVLYAEARDLLDRRGIRVIRSLVGNFVTSLEMQGASISVLRMSETLTRWWDAPVDTVSLRSPLR